MYDCHNHTSFSQDSREDICIVVETAINKGLKGIAITDHIEPTKNGYGFETLNQKGEKNSYDDYINKVKEVQNKYEKKIDVILGCEVGVLNDTKYKKEIDSILNNSVFDFVILSTHQVGERHLCVGCDFFSNDKIKSYNEYLLSVLESVKLFNGFNVYGHLDYITRYSHYEDNKLNYCEHKEIIDEILKVIIKKDCGLDVNTSGTRYGYEGLYPQNDILKRYRELGGKILTIGSDSHGKELVGNRFDFAKQCLLECGFKEAVYFKNKVPNFYKL
ncbi:MAG: histidinol-phosphatase HisJ family protein [Lachnospirales bacterium]